jgi:oligoribonuclease NrnB/cAMP/cGMP phosphodiesterase (DHH superfamily)
MEHSGAVLTWKFFTTAKFFISMPAFLLDIEDRDLWKWEREDSKAVTAALALYYMDDWKSWGRFEDPKTHANLRAEGEQILRVNEHVVANSVKRFKGTVVLDGHVVPCANHSTLISETLNRVLKEKPDAPFAASYFDIIEEQKRVFSLRSEDRRVDVSKIAKLYGGGGHRNAAGFSVPIHPLPEEPKK